ncbi:MAG: peptidylprolyl isomerase [Prevotella sp.]|nr:peptidylprolyl isomerase [Prevotella sp.]
MNKELKYFAAFTALLLVCGMSAKGGRTTAPATDDDSTGTKIERRLVPDNSIVDEVVWVVGDEPILKSDIEAMRLQAEVEGVSWGGDPDCVIPEELAVQKLYLHQAAIDSIEVTESEIAQGVEMQINRWIQIAGSKERLEELRGQTVTQMRTQMHDDFKNQKLVQKMREQLVEDITVTPSDVRNYFRNLPEDSIPFVPTEVEVEIITKQPKIDIEEINRVKNKLREYTEQVNSGEMTFAALARLYSEDGSSRQGGELGYTGRGLFDPAFATVAFNLTDPKKVSKIVESEFGYHIIQLIDKRGDKVNVRHILLKPKVSAEAIEEGKLRLDSIADNIREGKFTFEDAATYVSDDKDTRSNHGLMAYTDDYGNRTSRFQMKDLPTEVAVAVEGLKEGEVSKAFQMINSKGKTVCAIVKLKKRTAAHRATIAEDYQVLKSIVLQKEREDFLHQWVVDKIKTTYVRMSDRYKTCDFKYQGWIK